MSRAVGEHTTPRSRSAPPQRPSGITSAIVHQYEGESSTAKKRTYESVHGLNAHGTAVRDTVFGDPSTASPMHRRASVAVRNAAGDLFGSASGATSEALNRRESPDGMLGGKRILLAAHEPTGADVLVYGRKVGDSVGRRYSCMGDNAASPQKVNAAAYAGAVGMPSRSTASVKAEASDGRRYSLTRPSVPLHVQHPRLHAHQSGVHAKELLAGLPADWRQDAISARANRPSSAEGGAAGGGMGSPRAIDFAACGATVSGARSLEHASSDLTDALGGAPLVHRESSEKLGYGDAARRAVRVGSPIFGRSFGLARSASGGELHPASTSGGGDRASGGGSSRRGRSASPSTRYSSGSTRSPRREMRDEEDAMPTPTALPRSGWSASGAHGLTSDELFRVRQTHGLRGPVIMYVTGLLD